MGGQTVGSCGAKRTAYQPTDDEWRCPRCGSYEFCVEEIAEACQDDECTLLHEDDECSCPEGDCGYYASGKQVARYLQRKHNLVQCPRCKGTGVVEKRR